MRLFRTPIWLHHWFNRYTWKIETEEKFLYLSFDDGPDPEVTPFVIDTLAKFDAKAIFFCVGENLRKFPHIKNQLLENGHLIGNHTQHHLKGWSTSNELYFNNIQECEKYIGESSGTKFFRPPYGRIRSSQGTWLLKNGYRCIMWDILTYDYDAHLNVQHAIKQLSKKSRNGSIVVFHDSKKAYTQMKQLLPTYLQIMSERGYQFRLLPNNNKMG
jgi:peptidoglycan/xylan/chitin deacetylase (PgdA/CDA1 family)